MIFTYNLIITGTRNFDLHLIAGELREPFDSRFRLKVFFSVGSATVAVTFFVLIADRND